MRTRTFLTLSCGAVVMVAIAASAPAVNAVTGDAGRTGRSAAEGRTAPGVSAGVLANVDAPASMQAAAAAAQTAAAPASDAALLKQYCVTCHNDRTEAGQLSLQPLDVMVIDPEHAETWEKVVRKIRTGMMPPAGVPRPPRETLDAFAGALEGRLDRARGSHEHLASTTLHRLNRTEYANAIRDLLDFHADVATLLPADGSSHGFDNLADGLSISPTLIQAYVAAAMKISRLAVGDRTLVQSTVAYPAPPALAQDSHIDGLPLGTRGGMVVRHFFPLDAEYEIGTGAGGRGGGGADITIDGVPVSAAGGRGGPGGAPAAGRGAPAAGRGAAAAGALPGDAAAGGTPAAGGRGARAGGAAGGRGGAGGGRGGANRIRVTAGPHTIAAAVVDRTRPGGGDDIYSDFREDSRFAVGGGVSNIVITGPFNPTGVGDTPSRRRIFVCRPATAAEETPCARTILSTLARRAYRGAVSNAEIDTLMTFFREGRSEGDFESGIQHALARILVAPRFIYRAEEEPQDVAAGAVYRVSDVALASRLSFFLWSSIPDEELLALAEAGRLRTPEVLRQQLARMLKDPKSGALVDNFAGQWLYLRELADFQSEAKHFDDSLRHAFQRETELMFEAIVREDRSLLDLLDADYTYVNDRLARFYGLEGVTGSYFRRVKLPADNPRRGLLGQGSMLTVTSVATRTSPVMRGKWILENLFGAPPPEPPPGVETNLEEPTPDTPTTLRQRLELHRRNPTCASCHRIMDPLGFALENFDEVGAWRDREGTFPIDSTGQLADGTPLTGPADLRAALLGRSDAFVSTVAEKLLMYAIGRPLRAGDMPEVRAIARRAAADGYKFSTLLAGIVESDQFQKRVKAK